MGLNKIKINDITTINTGVVYDISKTTGRTYNTLSDALGTDGNNVPPEVREGGMSVRFVHTSDNKYVQYRLMNTAWSTIVSDWQGVDDKPTLDSDNLPTSNGVILFALQYYESIKEQIKYHYGTISNTDYSPAFNKLRLGCEYLLIQTFGTNNVRICLKIWDANGDLLKSVSFGDCIYDTEKGIYYKTIKVPSGAYAYLACYDSSYTGDVTNMFVIQYLKKENAELPPLTKVWSSNLLNASNVVDGVIMTNGTIALSASYITTDFIPVEQNTVYNIKNNTWADVNSRRIVQYNRGGIVIANISIDNVSSITTDNACYYIRLSIEKHNFDSIENVGVFKNDVNTFSHYGYSLDVEKNIEYGSKNSNSILTKKDLEKELLEQKEYIDNKIDDKIEPYQFLEDSFEKLVSENLLNDDYFLENTLVDTNNDTFPSSIYSSYKDLPITAGSFIIKNIDWEDVQVRIWSVRNSNGTRLAYGENASAITLPANSAVISLSFNKNVLSKLIGLFSSSAESYSGIFDDYIGIKLEALYKELPKNALVKKQDLEDIKSEILGNVNNIEEEIQDIRESLSPEDVTLTVNNNEVNFSSSNTVLKCSKSSGINGVFNFTQRTVGGVTSNMGDDVAPIHIAIKEGGGVTTIGANHGWVYTAQATIPSHGKTNSFIGTLWTDSDDNIYVLAEIIDADNILFLPQNKGNRIDIDLYTTNMVVGNISSGSEIMNVTSVSHLQLHNSVTTHTLHIYDANGEEVVNDGTYKSKFFDVVESYEIKNLADIISNLIARQSQTPIPTDEPEFIGHGMVKVTNLYRIFDNTSALVSANIHPLQKIYLNNGDMMFSQSQYLVSGTTSIQHYAPGSKPTSSYDLTKPTSVDWSASGNPSFYANIQSQQDENVPINRIIQYYPNKYGFALGFLNYAGVSKNLLINTNNSFEIRGYSGKVYPHGVEGSKIGSIIDVGDCFSAVMYRVNIDVNTKTNERLSYYSIEAPDGYTYLFADYASDCIDKIVLGTKFNGKPVELVESNNCSLMSDVYNDGVLINAIYTNNQTSYIILKIKS